MVTYIPLYMHSIEVNDPDLARELTVDRQGYRPTSTTQRSKVISQSYGKTFGAMVAGLTGPEWKWRRDLLVPHFQPRRMLPPLFPYVMERTTELVDTLKQYCNSGEPVEFDILMTEITIDIIFHYVMGEDRRALNREINYEQSQQLSEMYRNVWNGSLRMIMGQILTGISTRMFLPSGWQKEYDKMDNYIGRVISHVIDKWRGLEDNLPPMVQMSRDERYDWDTVEGRKNLTAEINVLMFAGHDTTGHSLSMLLYKIAEHQNIQQKAFEEVRKHFGNPADVKKVTADELSKMTYVSSCIKESARMDPIAPAVVVETTKDTIIRDYRIPAGTSLKVNLLGINYDEEYYPQPYTFYPERWLEGTNEVFEDLNEAGKQKTQMPEMTFSWGAHSCLGKNLAVLELRAITSMLLNNYKFNVVEGFKMEVKMEGLCKPKNGVYLTLSSRD